MFSKPLRKFWQKAHPTRPNSIPAAKDPSSSSLQTLCPSLLQPLSTRRIPRHIWYSKSLSEAPNWPADTTSGLSLPAQSRVTGAPQSPPKSFPQRVRTQVCTVPVPAHNLQNLFEKHRNVIAGSAPQANKSRHFERDPSVGTGLETSAALVDYNVDLPGGVVAEKSHTQQKKVRSVWFRFRLIDFEIIQKPWRKFFSICRFRRLLVRFGRNKKQFNNKIVVTFIDVTMTFFQDDSC